MLSKENFKITIYETDLRDEVALKLSNSFREQSVLNIKFTLMSQTMLLANLSHDHLMTAKIKNNPLVTSLQITDCNVNRLCFERIFTDPSEHWNSIDLSGCTIGDEEFKNIFEGLSFNCTVLNLSQNCLTSAKYYLRLLQHCIIKKFIFSHHSSLNRRCIFSEKDLNLLHSEKQILNFLHKIPFIVIESVYDNSFKSESQPQMCSSQFLYFTVDDEQCLHCDGFVMNYEKCKISIILKSSANKDIVKSYDKSVLCSVISEVHAILNSLTSYDCLDILDLSEATNTSSHCASIISVFVNENRLLDTIKELWITLEQFTVRFVKVFVKVAKHCHTEKLLVIGNDIQHKCVNTQVARRQSRLKMFNCIMSI